MYIKGKPYWLYWEEKRQGKPTWIKRHLKDATILFGLKLQTFKMTEV